MNELLVFFTPQAVFKTLLLLRETHNEEFEHCLNAVLYIAAHSDGVLQRDACRFLIYIILGNGDDPKLIRRIYRKAIIGPSTTGEENFKNLDYDMQNELSRFNPILIKLIADQPELNDEEIQFARKVTTAQFQDEILYNQDLSGSMFIRVINKIFGKG